jgi:phosphoglycerate dehydrogenase-like enzyme
MPPPSAATWARDAFDEALGDFAIAYARQTVRDHAALVKAVRSGHLEALIEEE